MGAHLRNGRNISEEQQRRELELQSRYPISPAAAERIAELERSLPPLPDLGRTYSRPDPIDLNQGVSPRDVNTLATSLALASSASTPVPAHIDRLVLNRSQSTAPPLIPIPTIENRPMTPAVTQTNAETHQETPVTTTEEEEYVPPSETAKSMLDHQWLLFERARQAGNEPLMRTAINQAISTQELLTSLVGHEEMIRLSVGWSAQEELTFLETSRREATNRTTPMPVQSQVVPMEREQSHQQPISSAQNPSTNSGHYVPGLYPFGNSRAVVTTPSTANSTAYFTPGVPGTTRHNKTGDAPSNIRQPSISTPNQSTTVLPPAPPSLRASSPTTWTRPRQRMATDRSEHEDGKDGSFFRKSGESPRTNEPSSWSRQGRKKPPLSTISESSTSPISSPLDNHLETSVNCPSDPSSKEQFLNNLNSQFVPDTTFLLEDKLRDMFSNFLSELTTTLDTVSPTLVQACVSQFESSVHKSIQEMLTNDIMPVIVSEVLHYVTNNPLNNEPIVSIREELNPLKDFIKENIECVQDILHVNDSQMQSNTDQLKQNVIELQKTQHEQFHYIIQQLKELHHNENNRFDQLQRRLGDMNQMISTLPEKINHLPAPEERAPPPHLHYNNPFLNHMKHGPPVLQEPTVPHQPETAVSPVPVTNNEPEWMTLFPFIKHNIDKEVRREIWKAIPKTNEWETFNGELPYNHELWLQNIEVFVKDYYLLDHMIVSRLTTILTSTAKNWYLGLRNKHEDKSWAWWKNAIRNKFGTDNWKWRVQQEFDADHFYLENKKIHKWFNTQRDRLRAFQPDLSEFLVCEKIMKQCPGTLYHAIESRYKGDPSNMCFEDMVIIAEDIIDRTMRPTKPTYHSPYQSNRQSSQPQYPPRKGDSQKQDSDTKKTSPSPNGTKGPKYFFCLQTGHLSKDCLRKEIELIMLKDNLVKMNLKRMIDKMTMTMTNL
ncbi:hypothetical protein Pst134EB_016449 [Puccinia striiformis f. sp. tritici]|nr:hypothetical protein Pst134EB_016449 [Puccinia striiformis f. sp. tritici]